MGAHEEDWVVVRHFDDGMAAEIALNFLRDHDVTVATQGSTTNGVLNRFTTVVDIRLVVPRSELERAHEVLHAMDAPDETLAVDGPPASVDDEAAPGASPYRATRALAKRDAPTLAPRYRSGPIVLAFVVPGGGHFYARHNRTGL